MQSENDCRAGHTGTHSIRTGAHHEKAVKMIENLPDPSNNAHRKRTCRW
jgi:hypothetical protein